MYLLLHNLIQMLVWLIYLGKICPGIRPGTFIKLKWMVLAVGVMIKPFLDKIDWPANNKMTLHIIALCNIVQIKQHCWNKNNNMKAIQANVWVSCLFETSLGKIWTYTFQDKPTIMIGLLFECKFVAMYFVLLLNETPVKWIISDATLHNAMFVSRKYRVVCLYFIACILAKIT